MMIFKALWNTSAYFGLKSELISLEVQVEDRRVCFIMP